MVNTVVGKECICSKFLYGTNTDLEYFCFHLYHSQRFKCIMAKNNWYAFLVAKDFTELNLKLS